MNKMIGYIYKIENPNGKIYIGKSFNIKNRFLSYKNLTCKTQPKLYNSLVKYGFNNHIISIIDESDEKTLSDREIYWIDFYNSYKKGLNCTIGGDSGFMKGELNVSKKPEIRKKMSNSKYEYYKNNKSSLIGRKHTEETKQIIKQKRKLQKIIRYYILDIQTGIYYESIKEVSLLLNINYKSFYYKIRYSKCYENKYLIC